MEAKATQGFTHSFTGVAQFIWSIFRKVWWGMILAPSLTTSKGGRTLFVTRSN